MALEWLDAGMAGLALTDNILKRLQANGLITNDERLAIIDGAISDLANAGGDHTKAADGLRSVYGRP